MPAALALAAAGAASNTLAAAGASVATQAVVAQGIATVAASAATIAITTAASLALNALLRPDAPTPAGGKIEFQQPIPPRSFPYGRLRTSGPLAFFQALSVGLVAKVVLISCRQIDEMEEHYLDGRRMEPEGDAEFNVQNAFLSGNEERAGIHDYMGTDAQTVSDPLNDRFPNSWDTDHMLRGIAYSVTMFGTTAAEDFQETFPHGVPTYEALVRGALVYDPRLDGSIAGGSGAHRVDDTDTHEFTENAALCVLDWLLYPDGYAFDPATINMQSFQDAADACDEPITLKAGGTEPRYRVATRVELIEPRKDVLRRLLAACVGRLYVDAAGTISIRVGVWAVPTVTLDVEAGGQVIEAEFVDGQPALSRFNEFKLKYLSPAHDYTEVEGDPWQDTLAISAAGGRIESRSLDLVQVPSHGQARRIAKILMARENPRWIGNARTTFAGLNAVHEDVITLNWAEIQGGGSGFNGPFWVEPGATLSEDGTVTIPVRKASETAFSWSPIAEEGTATPAPGDEEPPVSYDTDAQAYFNACANGPNKTQKGRISDFVTACKAAGVWTKLDAFYLLAGHEENDSRINLKNPAVNLLAKIGSPTFNRYGYWKGVIGTGFLQNTTVSLANYALNSSTLGIYVQLPAVTPSATAQDFRLGGTGFIGELSATQFRFRVNDATSADVTPAAMTGHFAARRSASTTRSFWRNGVSIYSDAAVSTAIANGGQFVGGNAANGSDARISAAYQASSFTDPQMVAFDTALRALLTQIFGVAA